jgi:D-lactate dehydrogenase
VKVAVYSAKLYDREFLAAANTAAGTPHELMFFDTRLNASTANLAAGAPAVCPFVNDDLDSTTIAALSRQGTRLIALRAAGFNNVDLNAANEHGLTVARVPAYSPAAVAEHTVALILSLNRKIHRAYARVREGNFSLEGLLGFDLQGKTIGIVGAGRIGLIVARIMVGFGCTVLAVDPVESDELAAVGGRYVGLEELFSSSDIRHSILEPDACVH